MNVNANSKFKLILMAFWRLLALVLLLMAFFFLPAGTLAYWEAWTYLAVLLGPMLLVLFYLVINQPELLARRMQMGEKETGQQRIINFSYIFFILIYLLPGFDRRFGWSEVPVWVIILANGLILAGYGLVFLVFKENPYASRIVEVEPDQHIITSGPYAIVRHPMYAGVILMYTLTPLALGSYWAMLPTILIIPLLVARIQSEERILIRDLAGYRGYVREVQYRLIPGIW